MNYIQITRSIREAVQIGMSIVDSTFKKRLFIFIIPIALLLTIMFIGFQSGSRIEELNNKTNIVFRNMEVLDSILHYLANAETLHLTYSMSGSILALLIIGITISLIYRSYLREKSLSTELWDAGEVLHSIVDTAVHAAIIGERDLDTDFRVVWPNGEIRTIKADAVVQRDESGGATHMIGINWDISKLKQILLNLISNAIKFTHDGYIIISSQLIKKTDKYLESTDKILREVLDSITEFEETNREVISPEEEGNLSLDEIVPVLIKADKLLSEYDADATGIIERLGPSLISCGYKEETDTLFVRMSDYDFEGSLEIVERIIKSMEENNG